MRYDNLPIENCDFQLPRLIISPRQIPMHIDPYESAKKRAAMVESTMKPR